MTKFKTNIVDKITAILYFALKRGRSRSIKKASNLNVRAIPASSRTEAAPLVLIAEKNAKGTAKIVLKTRESKVLFGLPSADSRAGRSALMFFFLFTSVNILKNI